MVRKQTLRRRMRGGNRLQALVVLLAITLGLRAQPTDAVSLREAYTWLNTKHKPQEIRRVAGLVVDRASDYQMPSLAEYSVGKLENVIKNWETSPPPPVQIVAGQPYTILTYTGDQRDLRVGEEVILKSIRPREDDDTPEQYELMRVSDRTGANEGRTYFVNKEETVLGQCERETCALPSAGGKRRKTLRRRK